MRRPRATQSCEITASYRAEVHFADERWHIEERLLLDTRTRSNLAACLDPDLGRLLVAGFVAGLQVADPSFDVAQAPEEPGLRDALRYLHRTDATVAAAYAQEMLGITEDDLLCLVTVCGSAPEVLDGAYAFVLDEGVQARGWSRGARRDGQPTYVRTRSEVAEVPSRGWTTNVLPLPSVPLGESSVLLPGADSRISIVTPKAMVARTFPQEVQRADTLQDGNEEVVVELGDPGVREVRVDVLATTLRSPPGRLLYGLSGWHLWPLALAALAALGVYLVRVVARESVSALAARLVHGWGRWLRRWRRRQPDGNGPAG